jgi:arabinogalactan endo-1,4-beta-galactosidase
VERYGPKGTFWIENPDLEKQPIREWQIWNEPGLEIHWKVKEGEDWAKQYGKLLRASYRAIRKADPKAKVVLGGIVNDSWNLLRKLYQRGDVHGFFDVAAVHPYTVEPAGVIELVRRFRAVMRKRGDGGKPLWVTEFGLPASKGKMDPDSEDYDSPLQTTAKGMAKFLRQTYGRLLDTRGEAKTGVARAYWYTWASSYRNERIWNFTGLIRHNWRTSDESVEKTPSLAAYRDVAK